MRNSKIVFTNKQIKEVENLASCYKITEIAEHFGISEDTFHEIKKRQPDLLRAYKKGRLKALQEVVKGGILTPAKQGNVGAAAFYLKSQWGWSTSGKQKIDLGEDRSPVKMIDRIFELLEKGKITIQESYQLADLVKMRFEIIELANDTSKEIIARDSREQLMEKLKSIQSVINKVEHSNAS